MRNICIKGLNITLLVLITLSTLFSCTLDASASARTTELEKSSRVARMIDETLGSLMSESVAEALDEEGLAELMAITSETEGMDGRGIVARMLEGEDGREILDYTYLAITSQDADEILESARPLVDQDDYLELKSQTAEIKARAMDVYRASSRTMNSEQQQKFYKELQALVVKAVVMLTAAVVYACIPAVVVWGKVSAACVAAVCAGVLAAGVMTVVGYKRYGGEDFDFLSWLQSVCEDSYAEWAIAASAITTASAAGKSPLITSLILVALAAYQVFDEAQDMLKIAKK